MSNNSNQTGPFILLAIVLGVTVSALMFFGTEVEQKNITASYNHFHVPTSKGQTYQNKNSISDNILISNTYSRISSVSLPSRKRSSNSGGSYSNSNVDFPSSGIKEVVVKELDNSSSRARTSSSNNYTNNASSTYSFSNSDVRYISNTQNAAKSDISSLLLIERHTSDQSTFTQQGAKRATPSINAKTASISTNSSASQGVKKVSGNPAEPNLGGSLPFGDGVLIMLLFGSVYSLKRFFLPA
ncbi:MAG: hypothetical protein WCJ61_07210 [Paludibacter sp.]